MKTTVQYLVVSLSFLMIFSGSLFADAGKVVKVLDGDTFLAEIEGKSGKVNVEVNLRCSDAPIVSSPFGPEARDYLDQLLKQSDRVVYKVQAYCGSEKCVEALAYIPNEKSDEINYLNVQMIAAGLARNKGCRGSFESAEEEAKAAKLGIWSATQNIVYAEPGKKAAPAPQPAQTTTKKPVTSTKESPAVIRYDRVERTVTIKSRRISLTRIVKTIDAVSPTPINIYLQNEQYLPINLEKTHWYDALHYLVETADLKQVNLDGKIDLYSRLFYYKHVSPYLKVAGNVGVYMNAGSGQKPLAKDDGTTRYVFINDFENSAEVAQQYKETKERNEASGYIQVHEESGKAPVSDYGVFLKSDQKEQPVEVAAAEPSEPERAPLKPYSGERSPLEEKPSEKMAEPVTEPTPPPVLAAKQEPAEQPARIVPERKEEPAPPAQIEEAAAADENSGAAEPTREVKTDARPESRAPGDTPEQEVKDQAAAKEEGALAEKPKPDQKAAVEFSILHAVAIVVIIAIVIFGCILLTRSASRRASEAEKHVDPEDLEGEEDVPVDIDSQVDKKYEEEIFEQLDHVSDSGPVETEEAFTETPEAGTTEEAGPDEPTSEAVSGDDGEEYHPKDVEGREKRVNADADRADGEADAGGGYDEDVHGPEREPRKICLFEVKCKVDGNSFTGIGLDISAGGMFVDSKETFDVGKVIDLEFQLFEDGDSAIRCRGAVTWYNRRPEPIKPDYPNGFGIRFIDMDALTIELVDKYLKMEDETT